MKTPSSPPQQHASKIMLKSIHSYSAVSLSCTLPYSNIRTCELLTGKKKKKCSTCHDNKTQLLSSVSPNDTHETSHSLKSHPRCRIKGLIVLIMPSLCHPGLAQEIFTVVQQELLPVHVASYAEEASWEPSTNTQEDPLIYKQQRL